MITKQDLEREVADLRTQVKLLKDKGEYIRNQFWYALNRDSDYPLMPPSDQHMPKSWEANYDKR